MGVLFIWYRKGVAERLPFQREGRVKQILIMTGEENWRYNKSDTLGLLGAACTAFVSLEALSLLWVPRLLA